MKCNHCGQEHPDNFQFCPVTGRKIEAQQDALKACANPVCPDFGKHILPHDSRFCPTCGRPIEAGAVAGGDADSARLEFTVGGVPFTMVRVEHGSFIMGATEEQSRDARFDEMPAHRVTLTDDYYMGKTQVTQALWQAVMGTNPSYFKGDNRPVEKVSWNDCLEFIRKLNVKCASQLHGWRFRLPTEAEWEYAARGGKQSRGYKYSGGNDLGEVAWCNGNSGCTTNPVAKKQPNELGLYDMSGNVSEWCEDWYGSYGSSPQTNPTGPTSGDRHVLRGGCWRFGAYSLSSRDSEYTNSQGFNSIGFRLALSE